MTFSLWCLGTSVRMNLSEPSFIAIGQHNLAFFSLRSHHINLSLCRSESYFISFFFSEWRVRFHTNSIFFKEPINVLTCTGVPPASRCFASSAFAVRGSSLAASCIFSNSCGLSFLGAPVRVAYRPRIQSLAGANPPV